MSNSIIHLKSLIREIPNFPKPGINFKDITPLLKDPIGSKICLEKMIQAAQKMEFDAIAGIESRGFLFGLMLAKELDKPFIPIRKKGKLPYEKLSQSYDLEYGKSEMEMHIDAVSSGEKILIHDDLLATGGTASAAAELIKRVGAEVGGFLFIIELLELQGRKKINQSTGNIHAIINY